MSQNSEQIESKLCAYIDGELDEKDRADIEKHLQAHPHHRHLLKELAETRRLLRLLPRESAPAELAESFQGQLERSVLLNESEDQDAYASPMRINRLPQYIAAAAVVVLAAGLGIVVYFALPQPHPTVALQNREPTTALTPDQQRLVGTVPSKDANDKDRAIDAESVDNGIAANGARPQTQAQKQIAGKNDEAMAKAESSERAAGALDPFSVGEQGQNLRKSIENPTDLQLREAYTRADGRKPMVIVVSAADPQKARLEASQYLEQLGVTSTSIARDAASDDAPQIAAEGGFDKLSTDKPSAGLDAARAIEMAKRQLDRRPADAVQEKAKESAAAEVADASDKSNGQVPGAPQASTQNGLKTAAGGVARGSRNSAGVEPSAQAAAKGGTPADASAAMTPEKKKGISEEPNVVADAVAPAAADDGSATEFEATPKRLNAGVARADRVIVAQNVTREQLDSLRESFQSYDGAQVHVLDGAADAEEQKRSRAMMRRSAADEPSASTQTTKGTDFRDRETPEIALSAKPGANASNDLADGVPPAAAPAAPKAMLKDSKEPQPSRAAIAATGPTSKPAVPSTRGVAGPAMMPAKKPVTTAPAVVHPGERFHIVVNRNQADADEIEEDVTVEKDGSIKLPESKTVQGAGASIAQVEARIAQAYRTPDVPADAAELPQVTVQRIPPTAPTAAAMTPAPKSASSAPVAVASAPAEPGASEAHVEHETAQSGRSFGATHPSALGAAATATLATTAPDQLDVVIVFRSIAPATVPATLPAPAAEPAGEEPAPGAEKSPAVQGTEEKSSSENSDPITK